MLPSLLSSQDFHFQIGDDVGSDHLPIEITLNQPLPRNLPRSSPRYQLKKADIELFTNILKDEFKAGSKFDSLPLKTPSEIDKYHGEMFDSFMQAVNTAIPKADNRPENKPKISRETLSLIKEKRKLRRLYAKQNDPQVKADINKLQKDIKNKLNTETNTRWEKFCNSMR